MRAIVISNISPRELNGKFSKLMADHGLSIERVVPGKRAAEIELAAEFVVATIEGTTDSERKSLEHAAGRWGKRVYWVTLQATHVNWELLGKAVDEMGRQKADVSSDWQTLAERYAEENDRLRERCAKLDESLTSLRERAKVAETAISQRRAEVERAERLEAELARANTEAAMARKRLAEAIEARSKAEARATDLALANRQQPESAPPSSLAGAIFAAFDAGVLSAEEVIGKLRDGRSRL